LSISGSCLHYDQALKKILRAAPCGSWRMYAFVCPCGRERRISPCSGPAYSIVDDLEKKPFSIAACSALDPGPDHRGKPRTLRGSNARRARRARQPGPLPLRRKPPRAPSLPGVSSLVVVALFNSVPTSDSRQPYGFCRTSLLLRDGCRSRLIAGTASKRAFRRLISFRRCTRWCFSSVTPMILRALPACYQSGGRPRLGPP